jgi:predicted DNA-binding ArsR family transcriptional regulator
MAVLTVSLELNSKHKDYQTLYGNLDTQNNMISSEISSIVSSYTYDNVQDSMNEIQQTVKERLAGIFGNEFVVGVNITPLYQ